MQPMLATPGGLPVGPEWLFEVKWDGMRLLADVVDGELGLTSSSGRDVRGRFPELADLGRLAPDVLLDGEVVLLDGGTPSFAALADRLRDPADPRSAQVRPVTYMVFDVLRLYGVPLLDRPLDERRATLERLDIASVPNLTLSPGYPEGSALLAAARQRGLEGVVAKRRDSVYRPGVRSAAWVSTTHRLKQVCLVGGRRQARATGGRIDALLLGVPVAGGLRYVGDVDVGSAGQAVQRVLNERLTAAAHPPFVERLPRPDAVGARWCVPSTAVEIAHLGWTEAGRLGQPRFRDVRDDETLDQVRP